MATMTLHHQQQQETSTATPRAPEPTTQILVKNTFIQFEALLEDATSRPRGESCDAVLVSHINAASKKVAHDLTCIPESWTSDGVEEALSEEALRPVLATPPRPDPSHRDKDGDGAQSTDQPGSSTTVDSNEGMTPNELIESLAAYEPLKRMALDELPMSTHEKTTIMLRNIPNKYTQAMLLEAVNQEFEGLYDFFYLPIDFKNKCNVGYAFINFIHPHYAEMFSTKFAGMKLTAFKSKKICEVSWGRVQGFRANIEHYRNSAIMSIPNAQYKPLVFKDGIPLQFPGPAGPIPSVKPRHGRSGNTSTCKQ